MARMPEGLPRDPRRPIPLRTILAALGLASALGGVTAAVGLAEGWRKGRFAGEALLYGGGAALVLWPLVLFAMGLMRARQDASRRPDDGIP